MGRSNLTDVPRDQLERVIDFNRRHSIGQEPIDYLNNFLPITRQFGVATQDDSWGELEKELAIAFRNLVVWRRALDFISDSLGLPLNELERLGEQHWNDQKRRALRLEEFRQHVERGR